MENINLTKIKHQLEVTLILNVVGTLRPITLCTDQAFWSLYDTGESFGVRKWTTSFLMNLRQKMTNVSEI